jgi:hypothetical protein
LVQLLVHTAEFNVVLQLVSGEAKASENGEKNEAVPELEPPADGSEVHVGGSMQ